MKDNLTQSENMLKTGQILLLHMSQSGLLELVKQQLQKLHKKHTLKLENGLELMYQLKHKIP